MMTRAKVKRCEMESLVAPHSIEDVRKYSYLWKFPKWPPGSGFEGPGSVTKGWLCRECAAEPAYEAEEIEQPGRQIRFEREREVQE